MLKIYVMIFYEYEDSAAFKTIVMLSIFILTEIDLELCSMMDF